MPNDALPWKNKYLELLDKQEKNEAFYNTHIDLLKRGLIRSSLAAEGNDKPLDDSLQGCAESYAPTPVILILSSKLSF